MAHARKTQFLQIVRAIRQASLDGGHHKLSLEDAARSAWCPQVDHPSLQSDRRPFEVGLLSPRQAWRSPISLKLSAAIPNQQINKA